MAMLAMRLSIIAVYLTTACEVFSSAAFQSTSKAVAASIVNAGIFRRVFMSFWAMSADGHMLPGVAATDVLSVSNRFKMLGIHAFAISAFMIQLKAIRNRANELLIGEAMGFNDLPVSAGITECSIAVNQASSPLPAASY